MCGFTFAVLREKKQFSLDVELEEDSTSEIPERAVVDAVFSRAFPNASFNLDTSDCKASTTFLYSPFYFGSVTVTLDFVNVGIISIDSALFAYDNVFALFKA